MRSQTQTKPTPKPSFTPVPTGLLQRKCACGNSASLTGKCTECENKRLTLQRRAKEQDEVSEVPPIVMEELDTKIASSLPKLNKDRSQNKTLDQVMTELDLESAASKTLHPLPKVEIE